MPLVLMLVAGCTAVKTGVAPEAVPARSAPAAEVAPFAKSADVAPAVAQPPQLVKTAHVSLQVTDAATTSQQAITWARQAGGELLGLEDSGVSGEMRRLRLEFQVPADQLDAVLGQFTGLGTLESRQISAEDVSSQLVDLGARLRNLRKSEELLLKIMERSGSVGDVLKVTQELNQVREQIEQLDAQRVNLQNRVRYARLHLHLIAPLVAAPAPGLGKRLGETWQQATTSLGNVTVGLINALLWLFVFSPYLVIPGFIIFWWLRRRSAPVVPAPPQPPQPSEPA
ncbi:MAG: DUF4349 domain-containing protein [Gloeomargarita sp. DG02_4_bins_56]